MGISNKTEQFYAMTKFAHGDLEISITFVGFFFFFRAQKAMML